jgi:hypothetical protein
MNLQDVIPKQANYTAILVIIIHNMNPSLSKKQIAFLINCPNPQKPRVVQKVFKQYGLQEKTNAGAPII